MADRYDPRELPYGVTLVYGSSGAGKTTLCNRALILYGYTGPTVTLDLTGDVQKALRSDARVKVHCFGSIAEYGSFAKSRVTPLGAMEHVVCTPSVSDMTDDKAIQLFTFLAWGPEHRNVFRCVYCDESESLFTSEHKPVVDSMVRRARNARLGVILATKFPTHVSTATRACSLRVCVFRLSSDDAVDATKRIGPSVLFEGVQRLSTGQYLYYNGQGPDETLPRLDSKTSPVPWHCAPPA